MNSFGLGLVLNFVDNASSGMRNATATFNQMSATADAVSSSVSNSITSIVSASYALDNVGSTLMNTGSSIIGMYTEVSQKIIDTGLEMMGYRNQLKALYGETSFEQKMQEIQQYAAKSVFDVQGLTQAVVTMKAVGIEAMNAVSTSSGQTTQTLMDYASDIAAMFPNMRNAYGTGVNAAMGALKEYIAEGNAMSLKRGAGLDITGLLGEDKGASIEERTRQVADLVEQLGIAGYTAQLVGTPTQQLSRMQDILFNTMSKIADSGVLDRYTTLLTKLADWLERLYEDSETLDVIISVLSDTINTLLAPLESVLDFLIENGDAIINWIKENPKLTKNILLTVAAIGGLLVAGGALLKLISSIGMASAGLSFLIRLPATIASIGTAMFPIIAIAGVLYGAWSTNMFGLRDVASKAVDDIIFIFNNLGSIFTILSDAWSDNTISEENFQKANELGILPFISGILQLKYYWDFFVDGFKKGFQSFFDSLSETLIEMGLMDTSIGDLITSAKEFLTSLVDIGKEGTWESMGEALGEITAALMTAVVLVTLLKPVISLVSGIVKVFSFLGKIFSSIGSVIGKIATGINNIIVVLKGGQGVGFFSKLLEVLIAVFKGGMSLKDAMTVVFGSVSTVVSGIVSVVAGVVMAVVGFVKQLTDGFNWIWEIVKWIGIALAVVGAIILGAAVWPAIIIGAIVGVVTLLIVLIKDYWNEICAFFVFIGKWMYDNVILPIANFFVALWEGIVIGAKAIATFFVNLWNGIVNVVLTVVNAIKSVLVTIASWIYNNVISPVVNFFMTYIFPIIAKIVEIVAKIIEIVVVLTRVFVQWLYNNVIVPIVNFFVGLWNAIVAGITAFIERAKSVFNTIVSWIYENIITPVANFFVALWNGIVYGVTAFIEGAKAVLITIIEWINTNIITPVAEFFSNLWAGIVEGVTTFIENVKEIFLTIVSWISENIITPISDFFTGLWEDIKTAFNTVADIVTEVLKGAVNTVLSFICNMINGVVKGINWAIDVINAIPGVSITKIELLELPKLAEGGVVDKPTVAQIGEDGDEAVVPLKNNTEWIDKVVDKVAPRLSAKQSEPKSTTSGSKGDTYDYSVTFSAGSIVIQLANATEAELEKAAEKLMKIIERKQQLKKMAVRA